MPNENQNPTPDQAPKQEAPQAIIPPRPTETPVVKEVLMDEIPTQATNESPKQEQKKPKKRGFSIVGCLFGLLALYILTIVLGVYILWFNKDNQAFLGNFGLINDAQLKDFLLVAINWSFFPLALIFLILTIIGVFIATSAKKEQKEKRSRGLKMFIFNLIFLFIVIPTWIFIYNFVYSLQVSAQRIIAEIVTEPSDTSNLVAPVIIDFKTDRIKTVMSRQGLEIINFEWDWNGDNNFETQTLDEVISHRFPTPGTFRVQVRVQLSDGRNEIYSTDIIIPRGTFGANPEQGPAPLRVTFDAGLISQGLQIKSFQWDFDGDNVIDETSTNASITHTFEQFGNYNITLQTFDVNDNRKIFNKTINVTPAAASDLRAIINYEPNTNIVAPARIQFNGSESENPNGSIQSYEWSFGDGSPAQNGVKAEHIYRQVGEYEVTLTIIDEKGEKSKNTATISVTAPIAAPSAIIKTIPAYDAKSKSLSGENPFEVQFDASGSTDQDKNIVDYAWDFDDDGQTDAHGNKTAFTFKNAGEYTVNLTVTDADDQSSSDSIRVIVGDRPTMAIIDVDREAGPIPLIVRFDGSKSFTNDGSKIVNFEWDFGDGTEVIKTGAIISHKYEKVGNYKVSLKVFSEKGNTGTITKEVYARVVPLQACFEPSRSSGVAPVTISFDATCSTGAIQKWSWNFGDGITSSNRQPTHTFQNIGDFTVTLEVTDNTNTVSRYSQAVSVTKQ